MSQISPPVRILLIGCVVFMAAWFAFLKPGGGSDVAPAASPAATTVPAKDPNAKTSTSLGAAVQKAEGAKQAAESQAAANAGESAPSSTASSSTASPSTGGTVAQAPAGKSDAVEQNLPLDVAKAMAAKKVLVVLFWNPKAADDRAVRKALKGVGRHHGAVAVHVANVKDVARYAPITRGVDVQQSPSLVVVDRKLQGDLLTGYVDRATIDQAVSDALRAG